MTLSSAVFRLRLSCDPGKVYLPSKDPVGASRNEPSGPCADLKGQRKPSHLHLNGHDNRINMSFSNKRMGEIARDNRILLQKIMANNSTQKTKNCNKLDKASFLTSAFVNRRRQQKRINWENQLLLHKIEHAKPTTRIAE
ncbi:Hypothetical protein NTJ_03590 [Nesidiocoris tenuis]|uniref:Uncharacterized protein n=1 Tax=Nesidiocoris tenuis TaxID=355587 RepID=A0ABN7AHM1_9HEMI|nr:Hypothetical protein NTJ_03590 [Nesidiocoris tenuis]